MSLICLPLQWILANSRGVPSKDSYPWVDFSTTICHIGMDCSQQILFLLLRDLELDLFHILTSSFHVAVP